jgi:hypothetical protein
MKTPKLFNMLKMLALEIGVTVRDVAQWPINEGIDYARLEVEANRVKSFDLTAFIRGTPNETDTLAKEYQIEFLNDFLDNLYDNGSMVFKTS